MKKLILPILAAGALLTGLAVIPAGAAIFKRGAVEVYLLIPHADPGTIEANEFLFDAKPDDPNYDKQVLQIYGVPSEAKEKIIIDASKVKRPKQKPELAYLEVDKSKGENPWQVKTVDFAAGMLRGGAVGTGVVLLVIYALFTLAAPAPPGRSPAADAAH